MYVVVDDAAITLFNYGSLSCRSDFVYFLLVVVRGYAGDCFERFVSEMSRDCATLNCLLSHLSQSSACVCPLLVTVYVCVCGRW